LAIVYKFDKLQHLHCTTDGSMLKCCGTCLCTNPFTQRYCNVIKLLCAQNADWPNKDHTHPKSI